MDRNERMEWHTKIAGDKASILDHAHAVAETAHRGQERKYTHDPYIVHPEAVALTVAVMTRDHEMIAAAYLHDVVEDTPVSIEQVRFLFGNRIAGLVGELTDVSKPTDGNRAVRKAIDRAHTLAASPEAKVIKLADLMDNTATICEHDSGFARIYMAEKKAIVDGLLDEELPEYALPVYWSVVRNVEEYFSD